MLARTIDLLTDETGGGPKRGAVSGKDDKARRGSALCFVPSGHHGHARACARASEIARTGYRPVPDKVVLRRCSATTLPTGASNRKSAKLAVCADRRRAPKLTEGQ